jgi:hypothetical protein
MQSHDRPGLGKNLLVRRSEIPTSFGAAIGTDSRDALATINSENAVKTLVCKGFSISEKF